MEQNQQADDLKAFERRLIEVISQLHPSTFRWRIFLFISITSTVASAIAWLLDPDTAKVSFFDSLCNHPFFMISCLILFVLLIFGIHKRVVAPTIIASRCRAVLMYYNMSCDDSGRLILKPRPS